MSINKRTCGRMRTPIPQLLWKVLGYSRLLPCSRIHILKYQLSNCLTHKNLVGRILTLLLRKENAGSHPRLLLGLPIEMLPPLIAIIMPDHLIQINHRITETLPRPMLPRCRVHPCILPNTISSSITSLVLACQNTVGPLHITQNSHRLTLALGIIPVILIHTNIITSSRTNIGTHLRTPVLERTPSPRHPTDANIRRIIHILSNLISTSIKHLPTLPPEEQDLDLHLKF